MHSRTIIRKNSYFDSVTLMSIGNEIKHMEGVEEAVVAMATELNQEILENVGLATDETRQAGPNDFVIAVMAASEEVCEAAVQAVDEKLNAKNSGTSEREVSCATIKQALQEMPDANVAVISVPGRYAAREAMLALRQGLHVMLFSDNVSIEEERRLKEYAASKGLLVMGPDCGTAAINSVGLCFANSVKKGPIGIVGASGTGLQEVMVQIDRLGGGVSQAIGTGGRDLKEDIGGIMMMQGIKALENDEDTKEIVLVSKPPAESVSRKIFELLDTVSKPVVVCFLEGDMDMEHASHVHLCNTLYGAAEAAVAIAYPEAKVEDDVLTDELAQKIEAARAALNPEQAYLRGFFCGGTLCAEAVFLLRDKLGALKSNVSHKDGEEYAPADTPVGTVLIDMGDDEFTNGRPHPMIEPSLRNEKIVECAEDPTVGVVLLDFEIGFGSHSDPAGQTIGSIAAAKARAKELGRELAFVGYICGTDTDTQGLGAQTRALEDAGVILARSNKEATEIAASILAR